MAPLVKGIVDGISVLQGSWQQRDWYARWWEVEGVCTEVPPRNLELRFSHKNTCLIPKDIHKVISRQITRHKI